MTLDDGLPLGDVGLAVSSLVTVGSDCLLNGMVLYLPFDNGGLNDQSHFVHSVIAELSSSTADRYQNPISAWNSYSRCQQPIAHQQQSRSDLYRRLLLFDVCQFNEPWNFHSESLIWKYPVNYEMGVDQNDSLYGNGMYQLGFTLVGNGGATSGALCPIQRFQPGFM